MAIHTGYWSRTESVVQMNSSLDQVWMGNNYLILFRSLYHQHYSTLPQHLIQYPRTNVPNILMKQLQYSTLYTQFQLCRSSTNLFPSSNSVIQYDKKKNQRLRNKQRWAISQSKIADLIGRKGCIQTMDPYKYSSNELNAWIENDLTAK